MAAAIIELVNSREETVAPAGGQGGRVVLHLIGIDIFSEELLREMVEAFIPSTYEGVSAGVPYSLLVQDYSFKHHGNGVWEIHVPYGQREPKKAGDNSFHFDTTGGTFKRMQAIVSTPYVASGSTTDYKKAINVDENGKAQGVDITVPKNAFRIQRIIEHPLSQPFYDALHDKVGMVNDASWTLAVSGVSRTYLAGEVLFMGATGGQSGTAPWDITMLFASEKTQTGLDVSGITVTNKDGWDYLWVKYKKSTDNNRFIAVPEQVNVDQVYERTSFDIFLT